jgi:hypothetical protein
MWATAPYLHNNSVGDYWVIRPNEKTGKPESVRFPNDGRRIGHRLPDGRWEDFPIDVSVQGRLNMFEDGMVKLLNPQKRRGWVKRTSSDCSLIPDALATVRQLAAGLAGGVIRGQLGSWLKEQGAAPAQIEGVLKAVDSSLDRAVRAVLKDGEGSAVLAWAALHVRARDHADRLFDLLFDDLKASGEIKLGGLPLPLDRLKLSLRGEFLGRLDRLDRELRAAALLRVPKGTPVNLYANLHVGKLPHAILAHVHLRDDPRALAQALLEMSACPDLVEDKGHTYGERLTDEQKRDLIEFLKTL